MFRRILVPTDGSDITQKAVTMALGLASQFKAEVCAIAVKEPFPYSAISEMQPTPPQEFFDAQERIAAQRLSTITQAAATAGITVQTVSVEAVHPWEAIIDTARQRECDLIVMASHGRRGVSALLLGSETQKVLTHTTTPVLVVR